MVSIHSAADYASGSGPPIAQTASYSYIILTFFIPVRMGVGCEVGADMKTA